MAIIRSEGLSRTEKMLAEICDKTFLKLWSYPNLYKADGKEVCDLLAVFQDHVFLFFDRESRKFETPEKDLQLQWNRWKKEVINKQVITAEGAKRYIIARGRLFMDKNQELPFPVTMPANPIIHKIIVAHGAKEACKNFSEANVSGSLAIGYTGLKAQEKMPEAPFLVQLSKRDPVHILDSHNLEIILSELDTVHDFTAYIIAKEKAIADLDALFYCGEEDLLAHYFTNFDSSANGYKIGSKKKDANCIFIQEGEWEGFIRSTPYRLRKDANSKFQLWEELIQRTAQNAFDGVVKGNGNMFNSQSAIFEMAMEPRFFRRNLSEFMVKSIQNFPEHISGRVRNISFMPSFYKDKGYVFLQVKHPNITDYEIEYRPRRQVMLEIACAAAKNKYPHLNKVIGIGIDSPKFNTQNAEDFILLDCREWPADIRENYEEENEKWNFFRAETMTMEMKTMRDFPNAGSPPKPVKISRNDKCPCESGKKYKKCCG